MEQRLTRVEKKVDKLTDEINKVNIKAITIENKLDTHMVKIEDHITGDKKIINALEPIIHKFPIVVEIVEEYVMDKKIRQRKKEKLEYRLKILAGVSTIVGIIVGLFKIL